MSRFRVVLAGHITLFLILGISGKAFAGFILPDLWRVSENGQPHGMLELDTSWQDLDWLQYEDVKITYTQEFLLDDHFLDGSVDAIAIPPFWGRIRVTLNGVNLYDDGYTNESPSKIFSRRLIKFDPKLLGKSNHIEILATGNKYFSSFKSDNVTLDAIKTLSRKTLINNILKSDFHAFAIAISLLVGGLSLLLIKANRLHTTQYLSLAISSFFIIPHHLLGTEFYSLFQVKLQNPFKFQLACQMIVWPATMIFFYTVYGNKKSFLLRTAQWFHARRSSKFHRTLRNFTLWQIRHLFKSSFKKFKNRQRVALQLGFLTTVAIITILSNLPTSIFMTLIIPILSLGALSALIMVFLIPKKDMFYCLFILSFLLTQTSFISDLLNLDYYLMSYGTSLISLTGIAFVFIGLRKGVAELSYLNDIVRRSLPGSVIASIQEQITLRSPLEKIRKKLAGHSWMSIMLVDICDWGQMNDLNESGLSSEAIIRARSLAFEELVKIASRHKFELIKTQGDCLFLACGLFTVLANKEKIIATRAMRAFREILTHINKINKKLRDQNLPVVKIKVSTTIGIAYHGLDTFEGKLEFDLWGDAVNSAFRLETGMDEKFYAEFGHNVGLLHRDVYNLCDDAELRGFFKIPLTITDKKGKAFVCMVGRAENDAPSIDDFVSGLSAFHAPKPLVKEVQSHSLSGQSGRGLEADEAKLSKNAASSVRSAGIKKFYIADRISASLLSKSGPIKGFVIDLSPTEVGIAIPESDFRKEIVVAMQINVLQAIQDEFVEAGCRVVEISKFQSNGSSYIRVGLAYCDIVRKAPAREFKRFDLINSLEVAASARNPMQRKSLERLTIKEVSCKGFRATTSSPPTGFLVGVQTDVSISFPHTGIISIRCEVRSVSQAKTGEYSIGFKIVDDEGEYSRAVGRLLIIAGKGEHSIKNLRKEGINVEGISDLAFFDNASEENFEDILKLRAKVLIQEGKLKNSDRSEDLRDIYDSYSRQIVVTIGGRVIATGRIVFNNRIEERIEHFSYGAQIPDWLMKEGFVESSRVIVDSEYRGDEIFVGLLYKMAKVTIESGHKYMVLSCSGGLLPIYRRFGFEALSTFTTHDPTPVEWYLCVIDIEKLLKANVIVGWALGANELSKEMRDRGVIRFNIFDHAKSKVFDAGSPVIKGLVMKGKKKSNS